MNNVSLIGRLTKDVEVTKTKNGLSVCKFTLAVKKISSDDTDFIDCIAWRNQADYIGQYGKKGQKWAVNGSINISTYENKDNKTVKVTEVICGNVEFCETVQKQDEYPY